MAELMSVEIETATPDGGYIMGGATNGFVHQADTDVPAIRCRVNSLDFVTAGSSVRTLPHDVSGRVEPHPAAKKDPGMITRSCPAVSTSFASRNRTLVRQSLKLS